MSIRARLVIGFLALLVPVCLLAWFSTRSLSDLTRSSESVRASLERYEQAIEEQNRLLQIGALANGLLQRFLELGYVASLGEVHPLHERARADLDRLVALLSGESDGESLASVPDKLREAVDALVAEKSREITTLEYLRELQSSKLSGESEGLAQLEARFRNHLAGPAGLSRARKKLRSAARQPGLGPRQASAVFRGLSVESIERLWSEPPLSYLATPDAVGELKLLLRDGLLRLRSDVETRRAIERALGSGPSVRTGTPLSALFRASLEAYTRRMRQLLVLNKSLSFMESMLDQSTRSSANLQATLTESRSRSLKTLTQQLIPEIRSIEAVITPRLDAIRSVVAERLNEAQKTSERSAAELREAYGRGTALILGCVALAALIGLLVVRAVNRPVKALAEAAQRIRDGDLRTRVEVKGNDEFRVLAEAFNDMAERVRDLVSSLEHKLGVNTAILRKLEELSKGDYGRLTPPEGVAEDETIKLANALTERIVAFREAERRGAQDKAIAQTTQMLAHDVRKPFAMLRMGLETLHLLKDDPKELLGFGQQILTEVSRALAQVDGLLADITEIGGDTKLQCVPHPMASLIEASLGNVFRYGGAVDIRFQYRLEAASQPLVDAPKILRATANIVENASQAMHGRGEIWFHTRDVREAETSWIELVIGNSGEPIPEEDLPKLFDVFFTRGKPGGTGLGLAIAHKVVTAHGGRIGCRSGPEGTEFWMRLPASEMREAEPPPLPASSQAIRATADTKRTSQTSSAEEAHAGRLKGEILRYVERQGVPARVLVVDDEPVYVESLAASVRGDGELARSVHVTSVRDAASALDAAAAWKPDLVICDADLGHSPVDGFTLVRRLRAAGASPHICVHSNRSLAADYRAATDAGADAFLPKPMPRVLLLQLIVKSLERRDLEMVNSDASRSRPHWEPPTV